MWKPWNALRYATFAGALLVGVWALIRLTQFTGPSKRLTGHKDDKTFRRYTLRSEQDAAIAAFYRRLQTRGVQEVSAAIEIEDTRPEQWYAVLYLYREGNDKQLNHTEKFSE